MELSLTPAENPAAKDNKDRGKTRRKPKPVLTLRPSRERTRRPLAAGLLIPRSPGGGSETGPGLEGTALDTSGSGRIVGPRHRRASALAAEEGKPRAEGEETHPVVATLDVHPDKIDPVVGAEVLRYVLDVPSASPGDIDEALELQGPAPIALVVRLGEGDGGDGGLSLRECAERAVDAGRSLVLPADATEDDVADFQSYFAHTDAGYFACADDADGVVRVLACAVAGITGFDVRAAYREPDVDRLLSLTDLAADAVRELLLGVFVPDPMAVARELVALGFAPGEPEDPDDGQRS